MAEMLLMKLGELMTKPAHARRALGERQRGERQRAQAAQAHAAAAGSGSGGDGVSGGGAAEEDARNRGAYESLRAKLAAALQAGGMDGNSELFRRLCNRQELRLVIMTPAEASRLSEADKVAWGTGGLRPHELRAILWAVTRVVPLTGRPAAQFKEQLRAKVRETAAKEEVVRL